MPGQVLVVDDLSLSRMILRAKLLSACYETIPAASGREALLLARNCLPDLVLLDCNLPDVDGFEICRALRADPQTVDIPIILFSADQSRETRLRALGAGADDFLTKPLDEASLLSRLRALMRKSAIEKDYQTQTTPTLRRGLAEAAATFDRAPSVALVRARPMRAGHATCGSRHVHAGLYDQVITLPDVLGNAAPIRLPDVFLLAPEVVLQHGLHVISELRSRHATRHIPIVVILPAEMAAVGAMALDLGAEEFLNLPLDVQEARLRLDAVKKRKQRADAMRQALGTELDLASRDPLTGLFNRRHAMSRLSEFLAGPCDTAPHPFAVLLIDLDNFKRVNDDFGHIAGDEVLIEASSRMRAVLGPDDLLCRFGGEEFLSVLPGKDSSAACQVAEQIRCRIEGHAYRLHQGQTLLHVTASVGVTVQNASAHPCEGNTPERIRTVIERADQALRLAKASGRNCVFINSCALA